VRLEECHFASGKELYAVVDVGACVADVEQPIVFSDLASVGSAQGMTWVSESYLTFGNGPKGEAQAGVEGKRQRWAGA
jgi:hypothetical protein